jgi:DNA-binding NarL/FixJ family response regulator
VIRVALLVETAFYRDGLADALARAPSIAVVAQSADWREAVPRLYEQRPAVVLVDLRRGERVQAIRAISAAFPRARVVALSVEDTIDDVVPLAEAGIAGYVSRRQSLSELIGVIESVARGEMPCSPTVAAGLLNRLAALASTRALRRGDEVLTAREREIVNLIGCGLSNRQIGEQLVIEISTVKNHIHNILEKLQVSRRADAVACVAGAPGSRPGSVTRDPEAHFSRPRS